VNEDMLAGKPVRYMDGSLDGWICWSIDGFMGVLRLKGRTVVMCCVCDNSTMKNNRKMVELLTEFRLSSTRGVVLK